MMALIVTGIAVIVTLLGGRLGRKICEWLKV